MLRSFLKVIVPVLLLAAVLAAAKYMDSGKFYSTKPTPASEVPTATQTVQAETETSPAGQETAAAQTQHTDPTVETSASVETEPTETVAAETIPAETVPAQTEPAETEPVKTERAPGTYLLTFIGDCTFGATESAYFAQLGFVKTIGEDYGYPFANVHTYLENDDFTFLNLEGPLCDVGKPRGERYSFRGPSAYVNILTQNSVEAVSLSNNHAMDYGEEGYNATRHVLKDADIAYVEKDSSSVIVLDNGLTVGLYATMYTKVDVETMEAGIRNLKKQGADVIIYAPHWGVEGSYGITPEQEELAHAAIDAGANIVVGSHPHVLEPIEEYNGGVIYYSMGNFSFGGNTDPRDMDTALIQQEITLEENGTVKLGQRTIVPCSVSSSAARNNYQPTPYAVNSEEYLRVMAKLSGTFDGPNLPLG